MALVDSLYCNLEMLLFKVDKGALLPPCKFSKEKEAVSEATQEDFQSDRKEID